MNDSPPDINVYAWQPPPALPDILTPRWLVQGIPPNPPNLRINQFLHENKDVIVLSLAAIVVLKAIS